MKIIIICLIFLTIFISCKRTDCPAFPNHLKSYFPYSKGQFIKFKNQNNDTINFKIKNTSSSNEYSFKWNCKCKCNANASFSSDFENKFYIIIGGGISISNEGRFTEIRYGIFDSLHGSDSFSKGKVGVNSFLIENNNLFGDTIKFEQKEYYRFNKVKIINGKGLVEFYDNKENCTWVKIE